MCVCLPLDLNVLDWGKNNVLAIGLGSSVFLWNAKDGAVQHLADISSESDYVTSVSWAGNGKYLAVGSSDSAIQVRLHTYMYESFVSTKNDDVHLHVYLVVYNNVYMYVHVWYGMYIT